MWLILVHKPVSRRPALKTGICQKRRVMQVNIYLSQQHQQQQWIRRSDNVGYQMRFLLQNGKGLRCLARMHRLSQKPIGLKIKTRCRAQTVWMMWRTAVIYGPNAIGAGKFKAPYQSPLLCWNPTAGHCRNDTQNVDCTHHHYQHHPRTTADVVRSAR